jgi:predicted metalloprotease
MEWEDREESQNVEDRRRFGKKTGIALGGGAGILLVLLGLVFGVDPQKFAGLLGQGQQNAGADQQNGQAADPEEEKQAHFTKIIFHDTEVVWDELFRQMNRQYEKPVLVLYTGRDQSACGTAESAVGPFYCPGDSKVYIDVSFYEDMQKSLSAPGDFARAYVVAHEVGHHVQRLLGYSDQVDRARRTMSKAEYNKMSVRLELQADYLAGVWAHHGQQKYHFLQKGDVESALNAAFQIGDDRLQKQAQGRVVPDSFTHGTSKQRTRWFQEGLETGDVDRARLLFDLSYDKL